MTIAHFIHFRQTFAARDRAVLDALATRVSSVSQACDFAISSDQVLQLLQRALPGLPAGDVAAIQSYVTINQLVEAAGGTATPRSGTVGAAAGDDSTRTLRGSTRELQESQMEFNRQYLELERSVKEENRSYTEVSNIMKTKHDTVKDSVSNVR